MGLMLVNILVSTILFVRGADYEHADTAISGREDASPPAGVDAKAADAVQYIAVLVIGCGGAIATWQLSTLGLTFYLVAILLNFFLGLPYIPHFFYCIRYAIDLALYLLASNLR